MNSRGVWFAYVLVASVFALWATLAMAEGLQYKIVTASERGTYIVLARDLAGHVAADAGFDLEALPSAGSAENVKRLRYEAGVKFAFVQADVMRAYLDEAAAGNKEAAALVRPLRAILPLYNEEIYFLVRADSPMKFLHDIKDARINVGPLGSGTALTATTLFRAMYKADAPNVTYLSNEDALLALTAGKTDVVAIVGGQPMKLLADMRAEAKTLVRLLEFDASNPASRDLLKTYTAATVLAKSYPNLLTDDLPALSVRAVLVTYDYNLDQTRGAMRKFARSLCANLPSLQKFGHAKWKDVVLTLPDLGEGWSYYGPTSQEIRACAAPRVPAKPVCSPQELVLGLCGPVK